MGDADDMAAAAVGCSRQGEHAGQEPQACSQPVMLTGLSWDWEAGHACSGVVNVSMSFCTARVPWVFNATVTSCLFSAIFCRTCTTEPVLLFSTY